jgi:hypothetical protein
MPHSVVLTLPWLKKQGISSKLLWWYVQSHWLERIGGKAYKKSGDTVTWIGPYPLCKTNYNYPSI